jgi:Zn-dependent protease
MLVALAGPFSNLILALFASSFVWAGVMPITVTPAGAILPTLFALVSEFVWINLLLMLFNLIPIAPLDGEKIITYFLPTEGQDFMDRIRPYGMMILMAVIFIVPGLFGLIIGRPLTYLYEVIFAGPSRSLFLQGLLMGLVA